MRLRWILNGILLLLLILVGLLIRYELRPAEQTAPLTPLAATEVQRVEISRPGEPRILMVRAPRGWRMEEPMQLDVELERLDALLGVLTAPVERSLPAEATSLAGLGLDPPQATLRLDQLQIAFGSLDPIRQQRYVATQDVVHLIEDRFYHLLIAPPVSYVSRQLLPREQPPLFGRIDGVPLAEEALLRIESLLAERVDLLAATLNTSGPRVELETEDGATLAFQLTPDRRRWSRVDQGVTYLLTDPPELPEDVFAVDPTPAPTLSPEPVSADAPAPQVLDPQALEQGVESADDPAAGQDASLFAPTADPDALVPGDALLGPPPKVHLAPDGSSIPVVEPPAGRLRGEPDKAPPLGFGVDPFAPAPPAAPLPDAGDSGGAE